MERVGDLVSIAPPRPESSPQERKAKSRSEMHQKEKFLNQNFLLFIDNSRTFYLRQLRKIEVFRNNFNFKL